MDRLRAMYLEEIAPLLIREQLTEDGYKGSWLENYKTIWISPSCNKYDYYDDALEDCIRFLDREYKRDEGFFGIT